MASFDQDQERRERGSGSGPSDFQTLPGWPQVRSQRSASWSRPMHPAPNPGSNPELERRLPDGYVLTTERLRHAHPDPQDLDRGPGPDDPRRIAFGLRPPPEYRNPNPVPDERRLGWMTEREGVDRDRMPVRTIPPARGPDMQYEDTRGSQSQSSPGLPRLSMLLHPYQSSPHHPHPQSHPQSYPQVARHRPNPDLNPSPSLRPQDPDALVLDSPRIPASAWRRHPAPVQPYAQSVPPVRNPGSQIRPSDPELDRRSSGSRSGSGSGSGSPADSGSDETKSSFPDPGDQDQDQNPDATPGSTLGNKNSRYLREMDRRAILSRLANGEKQSTLAKEYQVSRAAICNLNKHRDEVLSRADQNPLAKHPKKRKRRTPNQVVLPKPKPKPTNLLASPSSETSQSQSNGSTPSPSTFSTVVEVKSRAIQLLLTTLRNQNTQRTEFQRAGERMMRLLVEEALAAVPTKPVEVDCTDQIKTYGIGIDHPPCGISMEQAYAPMLHMFRMIEPTQPSGFVRLDQASTPEPGQELARMALVDARLPPSLTYHNVFLLDVACVVGPLVCKVIELIKERGAVESMIHIVSIFISSEVIAMVQGKYPRVHIITAMIHSRRSYKHTNEVNLETVLQRFEEVYNGQAASIQLEDEDEGEGEGDQACTA